MINGINVTGIIITIYVFGRALYTIINHKKVYAKRNPKSIRRGRYITYLAVFILLLLPILFPPSSNLSDYKQRIYAVLPFAGLFIVFIIVGAFISKMENNWSKKYYKKDR